MAYRFAAQASGKPAPLLPEKVVRRSSFFCLSHAKIKLPALLCAFKDKCQDPPDSMHSQRTDPAFRFAFPSVPALAPDASSNVIGLAGPVGRFLQDVVHHMRNLTERFRWWGATASYDVGVGISARLHLPTHLLDPAIDNARALIVTDLTSVGATQVGSATVVPPLRGMNAAGDQCSTDGRAVVRVLP
jgi:hypothetical protein